GLCHRLEEPLLLEEMFVLRMADERQMRVENEGEVAVRHCGRLHRHSERSRGIPVQYFRCVPPDPSTALRSARDDTSKCAAKILEPVQSLFDHVEAGCVTKAHGAIVAESSARHHSNVGFAQQTIGKILRTESELADIYQHVKRTLWLDGGHIGDFRETVKHIVATHVEFLAHIGERLLIAF